MKTEYTLDINKYLDILSVTHEFNLSDREYQKLVYLVDKYSKEDTSPDTTLIEYYNYLIYSSKLDSMIYEDILMNTIKLRNHAPELKQYKQTLQKVIKLNTQSNMYLARDVRETYSILHGVIKQEMHSLMVPYFNNYNPENNTLTLLNRTSNLPPNTYTVLLAELKLNLNLRVIVRVLEDIKAITLKLEFNKEIPNDTL